MRAAVAASGKAAKKMRSFCVAPNLRRGLGGMDASLAAERPAGEMVVPAFALDAVDQDEFACRPRDRRSGLSIEDLFVPPERDMRCKGFDVLYRVGEPIVTHRSADGAAKRDRWAGIAFAEKDERI